MASVPQVHQAALPLKLFDRLQRVRSRYAVALRGAAHGDYSLEQDMRAVSRYVGRLLESEARKTAEERGGVQMLDLAIAVNRYLPELRGWNEYELLHRDHRRLGRFRAS